jgi:hypothetical protein
MRGPQGTAHTLSAAALLLVLLSITAVGAQDKNTFKKTPPPIQQDFLPQIRPPLPQYRVLDDSTVRVLLTVPRLLLGPSLPPPLLLPPFAVRTAAGRCGGPSSVAVGPQSASKQRSVRSTGRRARGWTPSGLHPHVRRM